jgi:hypothetical protein
MKLWLIVAFLVWAVPQQGSPTVDVALERLAKVEVFAFGGVGFAGATSVGETNYKIIVVRPSAFADFEKLYTVGNLQAKCYALVGIRKLNPQRFKELAQPLSGSKQTVNTEHGCIRGTEPIRAVIREIGSGIYSR